MEGVWRGCGRVRGGGRWEVGGGRCAALYRVKVVDMMRSGKVEEDERGVVLEQVGLHEVLDGARPRPARGIRRDPVPAILVE